jgi:hypothetical protein
LPVSTGVLKTSRSRTSPALNGLDNNRVTTTPSSPPVPPHRSFWHALNPPYVSPVYIQVVVLIVYTHQHLTIWDSLPCTLPLPWPSTPTGPRTRPALPVVPTLIPTLAALMSLSAEEMSSNSTSGRTSRGSGSHSPNLSSVPLSVRYNTISVASMTRPGRERKRRSTRSSKPEHDDFSNDDDDLAPASGPTASNDV